MLHSRTVETAVGLFVALGLAALFMLAMKVSNLADYAGGDGYELTARFDNIGGLKVRSPVSMAGVRVGQVKSIEFDDSTYEAVVTLNIEERYAKIPADTFANIFTAGLLGEQYISLDPGGDEVYLKQGDSLELTQSAMILEQVIGQFLFEKAQEGSEEEDEPPADEPVGKSPFADPFAE